MQSSGGGGSADSATAQRFVGTVREIVRRVLPLIKAAHEAPSREAFTKGDGSLVTATDRDVERAFIEALRVAIPHLPIVAEESEAERASGFAGLCKDFYSVLSSGASVAVIDPIDGTKNFVHGRREFCVAAALVAARDEGVWPITGVVAIPAEDRMFWPGPEGVVEECISTGETSPLVRRRDSAVAVSASSADRTWLEGEALKLQAPWVSSGSSVYDMMGTVTGRLKGSVVGSQRFWDVLAPLALAVRLGIELRDLKSGGTVQSLGAHDLSQDIMSRPWGLARRLVLVPATDSLEEIVRRA